MGKDKTAWKRMIFKGNKIWLATNQDGGQIVKNGKVLIKYNLDQDYEYWVHKKGVKPTGFSEEKKPDKKHKTTAKQKTDICHEDEAACKNTIYVYTDGACSGNPGPSGIGVLMRFGKHEKEISKYIGIATNNIAELEAIRTCLLEIKNTDLPVRIFTDSSYACGVLVSGWKAVKNQEIIRSIKKIMLKFHDLKLIKVKGHDGNKGNERADFLATSAIKKQTPGD